MAAGEEGPRWYFTREQLTNSPSRADGVDPEKELRYRQDAASLIQDMGPKLNLNVLCMSTAIVYMHRFYMINSFKSFDRVMLATAAMFLAAKVEEHPRKLEHVAKCSYSLVHRDKVHDLDAQSEVFTKLIDDITYHELILLQTLGFDVQVKHPHPHVVQCMNLVGVSRDLSQAAFFLAHNSQLLTTFCLEYPPTVVACMCIHLTCAWKGLEIPRSDDNKNWWEYVDRSVTYDKLEGLATEFLTIVDKSPSRLKKRIQDNIRMAVEGSRPGQSSSSSSSHPVGRHPSAAMATPTSSNHNKSKDHTLSLSHPSIKKHHSTNNKPHPSTLSQSTTKMQRSSPPPPPPPHSDKTIPDPSKVRKHKEAYHHHPHHSHHAHNSAKHPPPTTDHAHRPPTKHSLPPLSQKELSVKNKRIKLENDGNNISTSSSSSSSKNVSLNDYRLSKRHHASSTGGGEHYNKQQQHYQQQRINSDKHNHSYRAPPLPPPLPSNESPPPPPPPPPLS